MPDYYKILGVDKDASFEDIRRSYRLKAKIYHPDVNKGADSKLIFQQINEAYHVLIDTDKRKYYDNKSSIDIIQYRKYGRYYENRNTPHQRPGANYTSYTGYTAPSEEERQIFGKLNQYTDKIFFIVMLLIGIAAIIFGSIDLFFRKWEGSKSLTGILFGLSYMSILLYGWHLRKKMK